MPLQDDYSDDDLEKYIDSHPNKDNALERLLCSLEALDNEDPMTNTVQSPQVDQTKPVAPVPTAKDIANRIVKELPRGTNQYIKATPTSKDHFRVNWFELVSTESIVKSHRIASSKFMQVTVGPDGALVVEDHTITRQKRPRELMGLL